MKEDTPSKITMFFYLLKEGDVKEPLNKYNIIQDKLYIIGRSKKDCDIVLDEKLLSRKHAELIYHNKNEILIRDLNSRNGTYINKNRIEPDKDIYFTINDVLSFGHINNEIVFYDQTDNNKVEDTDREKEINKINNYNQDKINISEKNSISKETKKNFEENISKNDKGYSGHMNNKSFSKKNLSRSRSNSRKKEDSKKYSGLEEIIRKFDEQNNRENFNEKNYNYKYNNRTNKDDYYNRNNRNSFEKGKNKDEYIKRNDRYENDYNDRNRKFNYNNKNNNYKIDNRENRNDFGGKDNFEQNGDYIKCYVSGYMMLKIKK